MTVNKYIRVPLITFQARVTTEDVGEQGDKRNANGISLYIALVSSFAAITDASPDSGLYIVYVGLLAPLTAFVRRGAVLSVMCPFATDKCSFQVSPTMSSLIVHETDLSSKQWKGAEGHAKQKLIEDKGGRQGIPCTIPPSRWFMAPQHANPKHREVRKVGKSFCGELELTQVRYRGCDHASWP